MAEIAAALASLPLGHVAIYVDEVDVHLNAKVCPDWMNRGAQETVLTPGKTFKRYLSGDVVRTVRREALIAVAHHWGVSMTTVWKWRKVMGVKR